MRTRNSLIHICLGLVAIVPAIAQSPLTTPIAATASTVVPTLVRYAGTAVRSDGKAQTGDASVTFLIYRDEKGGDPLWAETQSVAFDPTGKYEVHLGAMNPSGLPTEVFANGEARWLEVQVAGSAPQARVLLTTVPYAMKAADAATLGGLPASAFVLAGSKVAALAATSIMSATVTPDGSSTITTTGGTSKYVPVFTGTSTIGSSEIYDTGTSVGIGDVPNAGAKLDVNGPMIMRGSMTVSRTGNATSSKGYPSYGFDFYSNAYNSSSKATDNPHFQLQSEPTGNNTSNTGATFNLLYSNHGSTPAETGLSINPSGIISFASGQTFDSTASGTTAVFGVSTSGGGVYGGSTSGVGVSGYSSESNGISGVSNSANGVYGYNSGNVVNTAGVLGRIGTGSTLSGGIAGLWGDAYAHVGVVGTSNEYEGVEGESATNTGVIGISSGMSNTGSILRQNYGYIAGTWGDTAAGPTIDAAGIIGSADADVAGYFANNSPNSSTIVAQNLNSNGPTGLFRTIEAITPDGTCGFGGKGDMTCTGQVKTLATTGGGARKVETYSMQSPENWMEDFGTATLHNGTVTVSIDAAFAETVSQSADYHVFLTPDGDCRGLYVGAKTATGFEVHELGGGSASISFDYRIIAKRRGYEAQRMVDVTERFNAETALVLKRPRPAPVAGKTTPRTLQGTMKDGNGPSAKSAVMRYLTSPR